MPKPAWRSIILLAPLAVLTGGALGQSVQMAEPVDLPRGGISLAVPADCQLAPLAEPHQLLVAIKSYDHQRLLGITLSAYHVEPIVTAAECADAMIAYLQQRLYLRNLSQVDAGPMDVAGLQGAMRMLDYELRGQHTNAQSVCFVRPVDELTCGICYVLTVEAPADHVDAIDGVLKAVAATVSFQDIQPTSLPAAGSPGEPVTVPHLGFSIRPPENWYAEPRAAGVEMGQMDYTLDGEIIPAAHVTVTAIGPDDTAADCASKSLAAATEIARAAGLQAEVISDEPAAMGGVDGREFILLQRPAAQTDDAESNNAQEPPRQHPQPPAEAAIVAQRVICVDLPAEPRRPGSYALTLMCRGDDVQAARAMLAALADSFELTPIAGDATDQPRDDAPDEPADDAPDEPAGDAPDEPAEDALDRPRDQ